MLVSIRGSKRAKSFADVQRKRRIEETKQISQKIMNIKKEMMEEKNEAITDSLNKEEEKKSVEGKKRTTVKLEKSRKSKSKQSTPSNKKNESTTTQKETFTQEDPTPKEEIITIVDSLEQKEQEKEKRIGKTLPITVSDENNAVVDPRTVVHLNDNAFAFTKDGYVESEHYEEKTKEVENEVNSKLDAKLEPLKKHIESEKPLTNVEGTIDTEEVTNQNQNTTAVSISCDKGEKKEKKKGLLTPWEKILRDHILKPMKIDPQGVHFRVPVLEDRLINEMVKQEYRTKIENPMDFTTISKKLVDGVYKNPNEFYNDFQLIYKNCFDFNPNTSSNQYIIEAAKKNQEKFESLWNKWKDKVFSSFNEVDKKEFNVDSYFEFCTNLVKKKKKYSILYSLWMEYLISCQVQFDHFCKVRNIDWEEFNECAVVKVNIKETPLTSLKRCNTNNALYQIFREEFQFFTNLKKKEKTVEGNNSNDQIKNTIAELEKSPLSEENTYSLIRSIMYGPLSPRMPESLLMNMEKRRLEREAIDDMLRLKRLASIEKKLKKKKNKKKCNSKSLDNIGRLVLRIKKDISMDWSEEEKEVTPKSQLSSLQRSGKIALFDEKVFSDFIKNKTGTLMKESENTFRAECHNFENIENNLRKLIDETNTDETDKENKEESIEHPLSHNIKKEETTESQRSSIDPVNAVEQKEGSIEGEQATNHQIGYKRLCPNSKVQFNIKKKKLNSPTYNVFEKLEPETQSNVPETNSKESIQTPQEEQNCKREENQFDSNMTNENTCKEEDTASKPKIKREEFCNNYNKDDFGNNYNVPHVFNQLEPDNRTYRKYDLSVTLKGEYAIWFDFVLKYSRCYDTSFFYVPNLHYHYNFDEDFSFFMMATNSLNVFLKIETNCIDLIPRFYFDYINISIMSKNVHDCKIGLYFSRKVLRQNMMQKLAHCFKYLNSNLTVHQLWNVCKCANTLSSLLSQLTTYVEEIDAFIGTHIEEETNIAIIHILKYKATSYTI